MYDKYDRQVRLIGKEVQSKLLSLSLCLIDNSSTLISGEILKNFILLGVSKFKLNQNVVESYKKLVFTKIDHGVEDCLDLNCDVKIVIDSEEEEIEDVVYVCSKCYNFTTGRKHKDCIKKEGSVVSDCLLGAFLVQEIIKKIGDKEYHKEYTIDESLVM